MAARAYTHRIQNLSGGEAFIYPYTAMPSKYSLLLQNCHVSDHGSIAKIPGYTKVNTSGVSETLTTGFEFKKTDGTAQILVAGGGKIFKVNGSALTEIKTGLDTGANVYFSMMNNICIMTNGVDAPMKYDGTTVSALGGTPPATTFKTHPHKGRVWAIERSNKMLATHTALNDPEDYTEGYIDFKYVLPKGDELLDIKTFVDMIVFYFRNHIAIYSGTTPSGTGSDFSLVQLIEDVGVLDSGLAQGIGTDMAFVNDSGIKSFRQVVTTGNMSLNNLSDKIDPVLRESLATSGAQGLVHYPKRGWVLALVGNTVHVYSYTWKAWFRITGAGINGMFLSNSGTLYLCGTGYLYQYDSGWDFAGSDIALKWQTGWLPISRTGEYIYPKIAEAIAVPHSAVDLDIKVMYDLGVLMDENIFQLSLGGDVTLVDDVTNWDGVDPIDETVYARYRFPVFGRGRTMQFEFSNTSSAGPIVLTDLITHQQKGRF
jgi:hypothetical protein